MGSPWLPEEAAALEELRRRVADTISQQTPFPDVVGDKRMMRFLRGNALNVDLTAPSYESFLKWRKQNNIDAIRHDILHKGMNSPMDFPHGRKILEISPQIVISAKAVDRQGQPLVTESYDFSPKDVFRAVTKEEYLTFLIYSLEYRGLVLEQMSHEREQQYLASLSPGEEPVMGYGQVLRNITVRDLKGVGLAHMGADGRALVAAAMSVGTANYPEQLGKCHMINVPWVFQSMWVFLKAMMHEYTLAKFSIAGSDYMASLLRDLPRSNIPVAMGGGFDLFNEPFEFDTSPGGPFYLEGVSPVPVVLTGSIGNSERFPPLSGKDSAMGSIKLHDMTGSGQSFALADPGDDTQTAAASATTVVGSWSVAAMVDEAAACWAYCTPWCSVPVKQYPLETLFASVIFGFVAVQERADVVAIVLAVALLAALAFP